MSCGAWALQKLLPPSRNDDDPRKPFGAEPAGVAGAPPVVGVFLMRPSPLAHDVDENGSGLGS